MNPFESVYVRFAETEVHSACADPVLVSCRVQILKNGFGFSFENY